MLYIAICDDEEYMAEELAVRIGDFFREEGIDISLSVFSDGRSLLSCFEQMDAIFLDIRMDGMDGMETAAELRRRSYPGYLIFVTVMQELVFDAFDVQPYGYLVKPLSPDRLEHTLKRLAAAVRDRANERILIRRGGESRIIAIDDIAYCEVINRKVYLHLAQGETVDYYEKLENLEKELDGRFFKCHRSFLLNLKYLASCQKGEARLSTGVTLPVSRPRNEELKAAVLRYMKEGGAE